LKGRCVNVKIETFSSPEIETSENHVLKITNVPVF
jgi:hypothetical protein